VCKYNRTRAQLRAELIAAIEGRRKLWRQYRLIQEVAEKACANMDHVVDSLASMDEVTGVSLDASLASWLGPDWDGIPES